MRTLTVQRRLQLAGSPDETRRRLIELTNKQRRAPVQEKGIEGTAHEYSYTTEQGSNRTVREEPNLLRVSDTRKDGHVQISEFRFSPSDKAGRTAVDVSMSATMDAGAIGFRLRKVANLAGLRALGPLYNFVRAQKQQRTL